MSKLFFCWTKHEVGVMKVLMGYYRLKDVTVHVHFSGWCTIVTRRVIQITCTGAFIIVLDIEGLLGGLY